MTNYSTKKSFTQELLLEMHFHGKNSQWSNKCTKLARISFFFNTDKNVLSGYITLKDTLQHSCSIRNRQNKKTPILVQ